MNEFVPHGHSVAHWAGAGPSAFEHNVGNASLFFIILLALHHLSIRFSNNKSRHIDILKQIRKVRSGFLLAGLSTYMPVLHMSVEGIQIRVFQ